MALQTVPLDRTSLSRMADAPPGWYPGPDDAGIDRWWDGSQWTAQQRPRPSQLETPPSAGWYPVPETAGIERWWDGSQWTGHQRPESLPTSAMPPPPTQPPPPAVRDSPPARKRPPDSAAQPPPPRATDKVWPPPQNEASYPSGALPSSPSRLELGRLLAPYLEAGEYLVDDAIAQSVEIAEQTGRGGGEGRLFVTNRRVIHWVDNATSPAFQIWRSEIIQVEVSRMILFPVLREFRIVVAGGRLGPATADFFVHKGAAARLRKALALG